MPVAAPSPADALAEERAAHARTRAALARTEAAAGRFVPRALLDLLDARSIADLSLGDAVERKMTILFADIVGFTPLCEGMSPRDTFRFINSFLGAMEPAVSRHAGFVDKYMGDAVMALFPGGPDDAVATGLDMLDALEGLNATRGREGRPCIEVGIGLHTGMVMLGTVGGEERLEGTVVSDAVNLASRLEGLTRGHAAPLLISEQTLYGLTDAACRSARFIDRIRVKGKRQPQSIYEVFDADPPALRAAKRETRPLFEEAAACYQVREVDRAEALWRRCLEAAPQDLPAQAWLERCRLFRETGHHGGTGELDGLLAWREEFAVGIPAIDQQHGELLAAMNRLAPRLHAGDAGGVQETLVFLDRYVREHFGLEEALMRRHGYPFLAEHLREHANFIDFMIRLQREIEARRDRFFLVFQVQLFLLDWFANHTTGTDRHLGRWLRARGAATA